MTDDAEELNMTARKFTHKCTTYIRSFVFLASAKTEFIAGFIADSIPRMATLWDMIKDGHIPYPILAAEDFTALKLRDFIRKFGMIHKWQSSGHQQLVPRRQDLLFEDARNEVLQVPEGVLLFPVSVLCDFFAV